MSPETVIAFGSIIASVAASLAVSKWRQDKSETNLEKHEKLEREARERAEANIWGVIKTLRDSSQESKDDFYIHVRESDNTKLEIEKRFGMVNVALSDTSGKYNDIIKRLDRMEKKMDHHNEN